MSVVRIKALNRTVVVAGEVLEVMEVCLRDADLLKGDFSLFDGGGEQKRAKENSLAEIRHQGNEKEQKKYKA